MGSTIGILMLSVHGEVGRGGGGEWGISKIHVILIIFVCLSSRASKL